MRSTLVNSDALDWLLLERFRGKVGRAGRPLTEESLRCRIHELEQSLVSEAGSERILWHFVTSDS